MFKISLNALVLATLAMASTYCSQSLAWGVDGHKIVALIAESRLTPEARNQIDYILDRQANGKISDIASWADQVRGKEPIQQISHLVKIPFNAQAYSETRDCTGKYRCVILGIKTYETRLIQKDLDRTQKARALKFLIHYIGDIHQPLHGIAQTGAMEAFDNSKHWTLHKVWDTIIIRKQKTDPELIARSLLNRQQSIVQGTPEDWAMESHDIARNDIYSADLARAKSKHPVRLDANYYTNNYPIVEDRLLAAGIRLSNVLNERLK